ncbi:MAG: hypothetical protein ACLFOY_14060 [Desulfatibacillaceae bacterium]
MPHEARIAHYTSGRLRLRIVSRRGDPAYFESVAANLRDTGQFDEVRVKPTTGSVILTGPGAKPDFVSRQGSDSGLFQVPDATWGRTPAIVGATEPIRALDRGVRRFTGGDIDLPALILLVLGASGGWQILAGEAGAVPWYSALWYSLGLYMKSERAPRETGVG